MMGIKKKKENKVMSEVVAFWNTKLEDKLVYCVN